MSTAPWSPQPSTARSDVKGPLLTAPVLSGKLKLHKASITVPEKLPASLSEINIKHKNAPAAVQRPVQGPEAARPERQIDHPRHRPATRRAFADLRSRPRHRRRTRRQHHDPRHGGEPDRLRRFQDAARPPEILGQRLDFTDTSKISFRRRPDARPRPGRDLDRRLDDDHRQRHGSCQRPADHLSPPRLPCRRTRFWRS